MSTKKPIITIGIDSSTTNCGVAIFENGVYKESTTYKFDGTYSLTKLTRIIKRFDEVFETHTPDLVILEETVPIRNSKAVTALNQVFGAIIASAMSYGGWVNQVHNKVCKKAFNYKTKDEAIAIAERITGRKKLSEHEADAILLVETYKELYTNEQTK